MKPNFTHISLIWTNLKAVALSMLLAYSVQAQYSFVPTLSSDCATCDGSIEINLDNPANYNFNWYISGSAIPLGNDNGNSDVVNIANLCSGNYSGELEIAGLTYNFPFSIGVQGLDPGAGGFIYLCSNAISANLNNFTNGANPGGVWTDPIDQVHSSTFNLLNDAEGVYTYTLDDGSCITSSEWEVIVNDPADPGNSTTYLICENYPPFNLFDALFGNPEPGGNWYRPGNIPDDGVYNTDTETGGIYIYEIDSVLGCANVYNTLLIIENQIPDPGIDAQVGVCPDAFPFDMSTYLGGTPDAGGQWENAANVDVDPIFDPIVDLPGTYEYTIIGNTPCPTLSSTLTITFTDGIDAGEDAILEICESAAAIDLYTVLNGSPDAGGSWLDPNGNPFDGILDPSAHISGNYIYTVQSAGCPDEMSTVSVAINSNVNAGADDAISSCFYIPFFDLNSLLDANAGNNGVWLDALGNEISSNLTVDGGQTESFQYFIDGGACPNDVADFEIEFLMIAQAGVDQVIDQCESNLLVDLSNYQPDVAPLSFEWLDENDMPVVTEVLPEVGTNTYQFVVLSENICPSDTAVLTINVQDAVYVDIDEELLLCSNSLLLNLNDELPAGFPTSGNWYYGNEILDPPVIDPDEFNEGDYQFFTDDIGLCPGPVYTLNIDIALIPDAGNGGSITQCLNAPAVNLGGLLDADASPGGVWLFNLDELSGNSFSPQEDGILTYLIDNGAPCPSSQADWTIEVLPLPDFNAGADVSNCSGANPVQVGESPSAGYNYEWSPSFGLSDNQISNPTVSFDLEVSDELQLEYTVLVDDGTCSNTDTLQISIYPLPSVDGGPDRLLCEGDSFNMVYPLEYETTINPSSWLSNQSNGNLTVTPASSGPLTIIVENNFGCIATDEIDVELSPLPEAVFTVFPIAGCPPLNLDLINESVNPSETTYYWNVSGEIITEDSSLTLEESGLYDVSLTATSEFGCQNEEVALSAVEVWPSPLASFEILPENPTAYTDEIQIINTGSFQSSTSWYVNDVFVSDLFQPEFEIPIVEDVLYTVCQNVVNTYSCRDSLCQNIVIQGDFTLYVPNAFTPNSDGRNELFIPVIRGMDIDHYTFQVFNRWGENIFETNNSSEGWYGNVKGGDYYAEPGVYVWMLKIRNKYTGDDILERGSVTLIR